MQAPRALVVMPRDRHAEFQRAVSAAGVEWVWAANCAEARAALTLDPDLAVVVSELSLSDGNWYCMLDALVRRGMDANLILVAPAGAKRLDVAGYGVFGVLRRPLDESAVELIQAAAHISAAKAGR